MTLPPSTFPHLLPVSLPVLFRILHFVTVLHQFPDRFPRLFFLFGFAQPPSTAFGPAQSRPTVPHSPPLTSRPDLGSETRVATMQASLMMKSGPATCSRPQQCRTPARMVVSHAQPHGRIFNFSAGPAMLPVEVGTVAVLFQPQGRRSKGPRGSGCRPFLTASNLPATRC